MRLWTLCCIEIFRPKINKTNKDKKITKKTKKLRYDRSVPDKHTHTSSSKCAFGKKPTVFSAYFIFFCLIFERQSLRYESVHICCCSNSFSFFVHPSVHGMRMHILILFLLDVLLKLHSAYRTKKNLARNRHKNNSISIPATSYTKYDIFQEKKLLWSFWFCLYIYVVFLWI